MSVSDTLSERGARYGQFADHAKIAQALQDVIRNAPNWENLDYDMKQALVVITDKIARILNGDPFYADNWHDIQGYAKLVEDRINMLVDEPQELFKPEPEYRRDNTWMMEDGTPISHGVPSIFTHSPTHNPVG